MSLDEEEAKNEHELLADKRKNDKQHGISFPSTDQINLNQAIICTYDYHKDIKDDKNAEDIENLDIPKDSFSFCADCNNGTEDSMGSASICTDESGKQNNHICKKVENARHGTVNRCDCPLGFDGPLCQIRPVEGAVTLHLDYGNGFCPICGDGNDWNLWDLD